MQLRGALPRLAEPQPHMQPYLTNVHESAWDRGRIPPQEAHALRARIRKGRAKRRVARRHVADGRLTLDDDDVVARLVWLGKRMRRMSEMLSAHNSSYNMVSRPRVEFATPAMRSPIAELSEYHLCETSRFSKDQLREILGELTLMPDPIVGKTGCKASLELAMYITLRRWVVPERWTDLERELRLRKSWMSSIYWAFVEHFVDLYGCVAMNLDVRRIFPKLEEWSDILADEYPNSSRDVFWWVDGKAVQTTRPGTGQAASALAARAGLRASKMQEIFYNGYYKKHGLKEQHLIQADGITIACGTSIRRGDSRIYQDSGVSRQIELLYVNNDPARPARAVGDQAYAEEEARPQPIT